MCSLLNGLRQIPKYEVGGWAWVYNSAVTIRQAVRKHTDDFVLTAKLSLNYTGPYKILAVGPATAEDTPNGKPVERRLLYLDLPSDMLGQESRNRISVLRCKPWTNPYDTDHVSRYLRANLST